MIKLHYKIIISAVLVLMCTAFIFSNSIKDIETSRSDSDIIVNIVEEMVIKVKNNNDFNLDYIVRKSAHFFEFGVLGIVTVFMWLQTNTKHKIMLLLVYSYVTMVAFVDELIQKFTDRGSQLLDVGIDIVGAYAGITVVLLIYYVYTRMKLHKT